MVNHNNLSNRMALRRRWVIQISALSAVMLVYWTNMAKTGDGGLGSDSGEGA